MAGRPKGLPKTGGRQKGVTNKATRGFLEAQRELQQRFDEELSKKFGDGTKLDALIETLVKNAISGDAEALRVVMDRWAGRPKQDIGLTGADGGKMEMVVTVVGDRAKISE
jgi:hypothetical protein